jgi:hypothetical protein
MLVVVMGLGMVPSLAWMLWDAIGRLNTRQPESGVYGPWVVKKYESDSAEHPLFVQGPESLDKALAILEAKCPDVRTSVSTMVRAIRYGGDCVEWIDFSQGMPARLVVGDRAAESDAKTVIFLLCCVLNVAEVAEAGLALPGDDAAERRDLLFRSKGYTSRILEKMRPYFRKLGLPEDTLPRRWTPQQARELV